MTLSEKAKSYFQYKQQGDPRCFILVSMLSTMFNLSVQQVEQKIQELIDDSTNR